MARRKIVPASPPFSARPRKSLCQTLENLHVALSLRGALKVRAARPYCSVLLDKETGRSARWALLLGTLHTRKLCFAFSVCAMEWVFATVCHPLQLYSSHVFSISQGARLMSIGCETCQMPVGLLTQKWCVAKNLWHSSSALVAFCTSKVQSGFLYAWYRAAEISIPYVR